jgi:autotransporter-associated beta strand protein
MLIAGSMDGFSAVGTAKDFAFNTSMTNFGNYDPTGLPNNTIDVRLTTSAGPNLTITTNVITAESLSVANGKTYIIANATLTATNSTLNLGNSSGFTNVFSGVANDIVYVTGNSDLTIQGPSSSGGSGVLNFVLKSSGNFNVGSGSALTISSAMSGNFGITKTSGGTATLSGANTFSGTTTISGGTLALDNNNATSPRLANTSSIIVNTGGTLLLSQTGVVSTDRIKNSATMTLNGGKFNTGGLSEGSSAGIGALTLQANSFIDLGSGASVLHFASSSAAAWVANKVLEIDNWSGSQSGGGTDQLVFGADSTGLTASQVAEIQFLNPNGFSAGMYGAVILGTGEIVPVPEPGTSVAGTLALGALLFVQRRRVAQLLKRAAIGGAQPEASLTRAIVE